MALAMASLVAAGIIFTGLQYRNGLGRSWSALWHALVALIAAAGLAEIARITRANIAHPPLWDAQCFWLYGRVALLLHNVYATANFHRLGAALPSSPDLFPQVLDVGFPYPPWTVPLVAPLGLFSNIRAALAFWYLVQFAALAGAIAVLARRFLSRDGIAGVLAISAALLVFTPTLITAGLAQTLFLALLFTALFWRDRSPARAGIWLALGVIVKPVLLVLLLYPLIRRSWPMLASALATLCLATLCSIPLIGLSSMVDFVRHTPAARFPGSFYTESTNQSLFATLLRASHVQGAHASPLSMPIFLLIAAALTIATLLICVRLAERKRDISLSLLLLLALLIYPGTLKSYAELLILPTLVLWSLRGEIPGGAPAAIAFTALQFGLVALWGGEITFAAFAIDWILFALLGLLILGGKIGVSPAMT